jgi:hypothetical protein
VSQPVPESLRQALESDWREVRPLPPSWRRALVAAAVAAAVAAVALVSFEMRSDIHSIPIWTSWGCAVLELVAGIVLIGVALRQAVPGHGLPSSVVRTFAMTALVVHVAVGVVTALSSLDPPPSSGTLLHGVTCLSHGCALAVPCLAVTLWLIFRALPTHAPIAGLLGAGGAAICADAVTHLLCPISGLRHVLIWHTGAIVIVMMLGWVAGKVWERAHWRSGV